MRTRCRALAVGVVALALAGCFDRPSPLVICHNANCVGPDVTRDDTLDALSESLALRHDGRPAIDGVEWDTFWYGAESRCIFAHDLDHDTTTPALAAADLIAHYLATHAIVSWHADRFYVFIELKAHVGPSYSDAHTYAQLVDHAQCVLDVVDRVLAGARAGGHQVTFGFVSAVPEHFDVLTSLAHYQNLASQPDVELMLIGDIFAPYSSIVPELADYSHLDGVEYHPDFMTLQHREAYRALDIDLVQWQLVTTTEALAAIERWEPRFAITNEALLLRRWIEY